MIDNIRTTDRDSLNFHLPPEFDDQNHASDTRTETLSKYHGLLVCNTIFHGGNNLLRNYRNLRVTI